MGDDLFNRRESPRDIFITIENKLKKGMFSETLPDFDLLIELDREYPNLYESLSCVRYWVNRQEKIEALKNKGKELVLLLEDCYKNFIIFTRERNIENIDALLWIKHYVFMTIIIALQDEYNKKGDAATLFILSNALIEVEDYPRALKVLEHLRKKENYVDGKTLSMLAYVSFKIDNIRYAKLYLREALFYDPLGIDENIMTNPLVDSIKEKMKNNGRHISDEKTIKLWLGVYGEVFHILDVKSALSDRDAIGIRAMISRFEADMRKRESRDSAKPRLMLSYLWLMSFLLIKSRANVNEIEMTTRKMASLDSELAREYVESVSIDDIE